MSEANPDPDNPVLPRLGSYQITRPLGSGGMSHVFQAVHSETGSVVALKVLPRKLAANGVLLQRFLREAKSAEALDHPNIVAIYDRGFDQGRHYLVLEYVEGRDLFDRVRNDGSMDPVVAVNLIREVAEGLDYAARLGMIHRDIKPANLLMTPDQRAKIIDLGLAFQADDEDERVTRDGTTVGTVDYMSPEQARDSRKLNERSDIYSLGCTFYYLLTGAAPYPGGNLADKLARHHSATIPDVRDKNPAVPADVAALIQKMMAKKPEQRFSGYQDLILALNRIGATPDQDSAQPLDVLVLEDEDDDDVIELTVATPGTQRPQPRSERGLRTGAAPDPLAASGLPLISLADLAALDADTAPSSPRRSRRSGVQPRPQSSALIDAIMEPASDSVSPPIPMRRSREELPLQTWVAAGVMVGLLVAILVFGVRFTLSLLKSAPDATAPGEQSADTVANPADFEAAVNVSESGITSESTRSSPPPVLAVQKSAERLPAAGLMQNPKSSVSPVVEVDYGESLPARLGIKNSGPAPTAALGSVVVVRRLPDLDESGQFSSLTNALGRSSGIVEIADIGPFHEDDFQMAGHTKLIRGRAGIRPMIKVEFATQALIRDKPAKFLLGQTGVEQLTLEGLDLIVDVRDLPVAQSCLFQCQGVDLTIRDCTLSIVNTEDRRNGFAVFRLLDGPRPNRLRIERSLIRGPIRALVELESPKAEVELDRSVVVGSADPLFVCAGPESGSQTIRLARSTLLTQGPMFSWANKPGMTTIRALGNTFVHVDPAVAVPWMLARLAPASGVRSWLDYDGEANQWLGWTRLAQWGPTLDASSPILGDLRSTWDQVDRQSGASLTSWPVAAIAESVVARSYQTAIPEMGPTLALVAEPHPNLFAYTVDLFTRLPVPGLLSDLAADANPQANRPTVQLSFHAGSSSDSDLGQFLHTKVDDPTKRYLVQVSGSGSFPMSPVRLPDGISLVLMGPGGTASNQPVPVFFPSQAATALIELHHGALACGNLGFSNEGQFRTKHWFKLEDSLLGVHRCRYSDPGSASGTAEAAIWFTAHSSDATLGRSGPFQAPSSLSVASLRDCWISTAGPAVRAEIQHGVVRLENCLVQTGDVAFRLHPICKPPAQLESDLILENCTVAAERTAVVFEAASLPHDFGGRPWVVISRASAFPRSWRRGGTLLGVNPDPFAHGGFFWQSSNDLYETSRFIGPADGVEQSSAAATDMKRQWVDLWGINHTRGDRGPDAQNNDHILFFRDKDRSRSSRPSLAQLELDPKLHQGRGVNFKLLPPLSR